MWLSTDAISPRRHQNVLTAKYTARNSLAHDNALGLARIMGAAGLRMTLAWQVARTLFRLGFAAALAVFGGRMIEGGTFVVQALAGALGALVLAGCTGLIADRAAARTETELADGLRARLQAALADMAPHRLRTRPAGALIAGLQRHPDALAGLVIGLTAARTMMGIGPLLAALAVAIVSWEAALTLLLAIPVMGLFFALLGGVVRSRAATQEKNFGRLAAQFADRIRTLPTILANHALPCEHDKLETRMTAYADSTMEVLRVAFLNAGIIDFFSALSIAVLAVFLGLGHLGLVHVPGFYGLQLWQSLFILIIAADFFTPFRRYAEQYHLKAEGEAAAKELDWYFVAPGHDAMPFTFEGLDTFSVAELPTTGLIAISGPSGAGKSTLLRMLAGIEPPSSGITTLPQISSLGCDWISTEIYVPSGTLAEAIGWNRNTPARAALQRAAEQVGLLDETLLPGGLDATIAEGGANLSGGQRMRIGIARILLSSGAVFADEPTAKLDAETAALVRGVLSESARQRLVLVATHDERLIETADRHYVLRPPRSKEPVAA